MEVRTMKTCYGLQRILFLDGALVHPSVEVHDAIEVAFEKLKTLHTNRIEGFAVLDEVRELTAADYEALTWVLTDLFQDERLLRKLTQ